MVSFLFLYQVKKVNLRTRQITSILKNNPPLGPLQALPCGMALDNNGHLIVAFQGSNIIPGSIKKYNLSSTAEDKLIKNMADNWFSMPFNSPNDVVVKSDGSIWFTDPSYARLSSHLSHFPDPDFGCCSYVSSLRV